ncbi:conserved hypothetical protein [Histoplasma capsulatum var. duboisii H88]|uniref:Uncharacterized protein n=1 Tax=Ajellomyces capsulatus (strain H88) TaxID=544711 RepID=F0UD81_AJEC8|nr:conserved hypothetical protein [Histoplasma capsulatum var. duboisii H88]
MIIQFNLEAAAMELPFNKVVQKAAHELFLNTDTTAPMELINELKRKIINNSKIRELIECSKELTWKLRAMRFHSILAARGKTLLNSATVWSFTHWCACIIVWLKLQH